MTTVLDYHHDNTNIHWIFAHYIQSLPENGQNNSGTFVSFLLNKKTNAYKRMRQEEPA